MHYKQITQLQILVAVVLDKKLPLCGKGTAVRTLATQPRRLRLSIAQRATPNTNSYANAKCDANTYGYANIYCYAQSDAEITSNSSSSAHAAVTSPDHH